MSTPRFTHLHTHTPEGSLLDGYMKIEKAIQRAKDFGMDALGVSDHGTMAAHPKFNALCKKNGIKPVFGMEAYITPDHTYRKEEFEGFDFVTDTLDELDEEGNQRVSYHISFFTPEELQITTNYIAVSEIKDKPFKAYLKTVKKELIQEKVLTHLKEHYAEYARFSGEEKPLEELTKKAYNQYVKRAKDDIMQGYIMAVEVDAQRKKYFEWYPRISHLLLIALTNEGYHNLIKLNNIGQLEGFYRKPRIDYDDIKLYGKGIAATSACLGGEIPQLITQGKLKEAKDCILRYQDAFDEFYLEVQPSRQPEQHVVNQQLIQWSKEMGIPLIATSDVHMVDHSDLVVHKELMNINRNKPDTDDHDISVYESCYFMHPQEFLDAGIPAEALENAYLLAHKTQVTVLEDKEWKYPICDIPEGEDYDSYLEKLAEQGLFTRYINDTTGLIDWQTYSERLKFELDVIKQKKISAYFIIVWDFLNYCHQEKILTGPGRGSAAGSLVAYSLGVTNIDPIRWNLLFERFLDPERDGFPDIDSDVEGKRKAEVVNYLAMKYGADKVAQIGTYITMSTKSVLKDIGRVLAIPHEEINDLNKTIPDGLSLAEAVEEVPQVKEFMERHPKLLELSLEAENMPKASSIHACGLVVTPDSLMNNVPLMRGKNGEVVSQYEGPTLESIGYIKFDILGLKNLSIIEGARQLVEEHHGEAIDVTTYPFYDDPEVFKLIKKGDTAGIFQLESDGMKGVFKGLNVVDFESVIAGVALYR